MKRRVLTPRLVLRPIAASDAAALHALRSSPDISHRAGFRRSRSLAATRRDLRRWLAPESPSTLFAITLRPSGAFAGTIHLRWPHKGVAELGYMLAREHWGRGLATEAARAVAALAFRRGAHRVQATCSTRNRRSAAVLRKAGLRREGVLRGFLRRGREIRDEFVYGMTRADWAKA